MANYSSLVPGGFYGNGTTGPVSIRANNPGAINGAGWERSYPGFVGNIKYDGKNDTTVFEAPEYGVAAWWELMRRYRAAGAVTIKDIVWKYGGGQANYTAYGHKVAEWMGVSDSTVIDINNDKSLLPFAKAMFRYESGVNPLPWNDEQLLYGFRIGKALAAGQHVPPYMPLEPEQKSWLRLLIDVIKGMLHRA